MKQAAIDALLKFLTDHNLTGRKRQIEEAVASERVLSTTGENVAEGVSVSFLASPRFSLVATTPTTEGGSMIRAEGSVTITTVTVPSENSAMPTTTEEGIIVTEAAYQYVVLPPEEVDALPGADQFIKALQKEASKKAKEQGKPPETPGEGPPTDGENPPAGDAPPA